MKWLRFLPLLILLVIAGCETLDNDDRAILAQHHVPGAVYDKMAHGERIELEDIAELVKRGLPDAFILRYLRDTYAVYQLTTADVSRLARAGVGRPVIDYLLATPGLYGPRSYVDPYPYLGYPYGAYPSPYYPYPPIIVVRPHHHWHH